MTFLTEPLARIDVRLEAAEADMIAAETAVFGERFRRDDPGDHHMSRDTWEPFDEDDYPPDDPTRVIEVNPMGERGAEFLFDLLRVAAALGDKGEIMLIVRSASTYGQIILPPRKSGQQNFLRIDSRTVSADLNRRISRARAALSGDDPFLPPPQEAPDA